jgi:hypothetical protein
MSVLEKGAQVPVVIWGIGLHLNLRNSSAPVGIQESTSYSKYIDSLMLGR